jgi:hypothetical protein
MNDDEAIELVENWALGIFRRIDRSDDDRINEAVRIVLRELRSGRRALDDLEARLEDSEHNCDMLLRYIDQALRDAKQLKASLDDPSIVEADADAHRLRSTRAYQIVKGLETVSHSTSPGEGVPAPEQTGALMSSAGPSAPGSPASNAIRSSASEGPWGNEWVGGIRPNVFTATAWAATTSTTSLGAVRRAIATARNRSTMPPITSPATF